MQRNSDDKLEFSFKQNRSKSVKQKRRGKHGKPVADANLMTCIERLQHDDLKSSQVRRTGIHPILMYGGTCKLCTDNIVFLCSVLCLCCRFRLQSITIHCNRRVVLVSSCPGTLGKNQQCVEWPETLTLKFVMLAVSFNRVVQCTIDSWLQEAMLRAFHPVLHARTDSDVIGPVSYRTRVHALQWSSPVPQRCHCTEFVSS